MCDEINDPISALTVSDTKPDDQEAQLDTQEKQLATSLKDLCRSDGGSKSGGKLLQEMGDIYNKRGLLTKCTQHFVTASALYNAALIRSDTENLEALMRQNEVAFCNASSVSSKTIPLDFKSNVKEKLSLLRNQGEAEEIIDRFSSELNLDAPKSERITLEKEFIEKARNVLGNVCEGMISLVRFIIDRSVEIIGPPPQEYAALGLGSLARGDATPYSDLEWVILVEDETKDLEYFRNMVRLVHMCVLNVGETFLRTMGIESLNDFSAREAGDWFKDDVVARGFEFDSAAPYACKTPLGPPDRPGRLGIELIKTPRHMAELLRSETALKDGYIFDRVLSTTVKLGGSERADSLVCVFKELRAMNTAGDQTKEKAVRQIIDIVDKFFKQLGFHNEEHSVHDIKKEMFRLPTVVISLLKVLFSVDHGNSWEALAEMKSGGILTDEGAHNLQLVVSLVSLLRILVYCTKSQQSELISLVPKSKLGSESGKVSRYSKYKPLICRYYYTILPFVDFLRGSEFTSSSTQINDNFFNKNDYYSAKIECFSWSFESARTKFISHIESVCESPSDYLIIKYDDREVKCDPAERSVVLSVMSIADTFSAESRDKEALEYLIYSLRLFCKRIDNECVFAGHEDEEESVKLLSAIQLTSLETEKDADLAFILCGIGDGLQRMGYFREALKYTQMALTIFQELKHHDCVVSTYCEIGNIYLHLSEYTEALKQFKVSVDLAKEHFGKTDNPVLASCFFNVGDAYRFIGNHAMALDHYQLSLSMLQIIHKDGDHPNILKILSLIGSECVATGQLSRAEELLQDALNMSTNLYGEKAHRDTALNHLCLGDLYRSKGQAEAAMEEYKKSSEIFIKIHGDRYNEDIADTHIKIGMSHHDLKHYDKALQVLQKVLSLATDYHGDQGHPSIGLCYQAIGIVQTSMGHLTSALESLEQAKAMTLRFFPRGLHPNLATCLHTIGMVHVHQHNYVLAMSNLQKALEIIVKCNGGRGGPDEDYYEKCLFDTLRSLRDLGQTKDALDCCIDVHTFYNLVGKNSRELIILKTGLTMQERSNSGEDHIDVANSLFNIGSANRSSGLHESALDNYKKALQMYIRLHNGSENIDVARCLRHISFVYEAMGEHSPAQLFYHDSVNILMKVHGDERDLDCTFIGL